MANNMKQIRLCFNCKNGSTCTFPKDVDRPSYYCEEYELEALPPKAIVRTLPDKSHFIRRKKTSEFKGLCVDCKNRDTCKFPKPEGGVWHCEEYL